MNTKQLTIRIPVDFHQQLVEYAEEHYLPVSRVITQAVAKTIIYKPKKHTPRTFTPHQTVEPEFGDISLEDYSAPEDDDIDFTELQRRAAAAPLRPAR